MKNFLLKNTVAVSLGLWMLPGGLLFSLVFAAWARNEGKSRLSTDIRLKPLSGDNNEDH